MHRSSLILNFLSITYMSLNLTLGASAASEPTFPDLPKVAQGTDVHTLSRTYCAALWSAVKAPSVLAYGNKDSAEFRALFEQTIKELSTITSRVKETPPLITYAEEVSLTDEARLSRLDALCKSALVVDGFLMLDTAPIDATLIADEGTGVESDLRAHCDFFDAGQHAPLLTALTNLSVFGKHKGSIDFDNETRAHVNEILVYTWSRVKTDPHQYLVDFLMALCDAAPTCIQGYSVRMLCSVHPPQQKTE